MKHLSAIRSAYTRYTLLVILSALAIQAHAYDFVADGVGYTITSADNRTVEVSNGESGYSGKIVIPATVVNPDAPEAGEYTVVGIGFAAFAQSSITGITMPETITYIANSAFYMCSGITTITLPENLRTIGIESFASCASLRKIHFPAAVESIGRGNFSATNQMSSITVDEANTHYCAEASVLYDKAKTRLIRCATLNSRAITVPTSVTTIEAAAFMSCSNVPSITLPNTVTTIGDNAFYACSNITSIDLPEGLVGYLSNGIIARCTKLTQVNVPTGITEIGINAMEGCTQLTTVSLPEGVTAIRSHAFDNCSNLSNINMPSALKRIDSFAFFNCSSMTTCDLPDGMEQIGERAFEGCWRLTQMSIPEGVTRLGDRLFENCTSLVSVSLPSTLANLGLNPFNNCTSLAEVTIAQGNPYLSVIGGILYADGNTRLVFCPKSNSGENGVLVIPEGVTTIGDYALSQLSQATEVDLPLSLTTIGNCAFYGGLTGNRTIKRICIPAGVDTLMRACFGRCYEIEEVYSYTPEPLPIDNYTFDQMGLFNLTLYVPEASLELYKNTNMWKTFGNFGQNIIPLKPGDMNKDAIIDVSDVNVVINIMLGKSTDAMLKHNADMNGDKHIDVSDVNRLINTMLGK